MCSFALFGLFRAKSLVLTKPFRCTKIFSYSAVLFENRQTYFGDMSSFETWQEEAAKCDIKDVTFVLRKFLDLQTQKRHCHMMDIMRLWSEMLYAFLTRLYFLKYLLIFISMLYK